MAPEFYGGAMSEVLAPGAAVHLSRVNKSFGANAVLRDVSLDIAPGRFVTIVGQSGCGKTTLLRLLAGLERPDDGNLLLDEESLATRQHDVRLMFQEPRLLPWASVENNVGIGLTGDWRRRARALLAEMGLGGREGEFPGALSGGQKQRVALARALISRPRLLLMDEPLGALDALTRLAMHDLITNLWTAQKFTAVLVTHDVAEAVSLGDEVILLASGRIAGRWEIDAPHPREPGDARLAAMTGMILRYLCA